MFFNGMIVGIGTPNEFFSGNSFYTTAVSRMTRSYYNNAITIKDAVNLCRLNGRKEK